jgi:hydrogenase/urease accessory protein HupE
MRPQALLTLALALAASLLSSAAGAHSGDATGFASLSVREATVTYAYTPAGKSTADPAALPALLREHIIVEADGKRCTPQAGDGLSLRFECSQPVGRLTVSDRLPGVLGNTHHVIAMATWDGGSLSHAFSATQPTLEANLRHEATPNGAASFFLLGVEHIATGYDHLLFVLALVLCGGSLMQLLKIVTAFTLAHSVTLGAAAFDIVTLPSALVESVIALSIAYVAFENLNPRYAVSRRWTISFAFGLIHGFGFSSVLKEIGLPKGSELLALLNFNLGVEAGQIVAVTLVVPLLVWVRRQAWGTRAIQWTSAIVLLIGLILFVDRVFLGG